jgi:radical SAM protein with 4Fe4S-binding SPASM domain
VNVAEKEVYWCFKALNETWGKIGKVNDDGTINLNPSFDLSAEALEKNLGGICGGCDIKSECLGGCRSQAVSFALMQNPGMPIEEAIYAGQPFCRYKIE